jgi:hypothetical protein
MAEAAAFHDEVLREHMTPNRPVAGRPIYFASWTGYGPPVRPRDPIVYEEAEASRAFGVFVFDEQGRAVTFENWRAKADACDPATLAGRALPAGKVFLAADPAGNGPAGLLSLDDTQGIAEYFRAHVHPDGGVALLEHVRRRRTIHHEYDYWEDGQLREWRFDSGGERGREEFDRGGHKVSSSIERSTK